MNLLLLIDTQTCCEHERDAAAAAHT